MEALCRLCRESPACEDCYVHLDWGDRPVCRTCWEQLLLDPRRVSRWLESAPLDRTPPPAIPAARV